MASFNKVILVGNLTRDPELRQTPSGSAVAELRLAVSETYRNRQTGEQVETTCFVDVVVWNRQAELCQQYLSKGRPILVEGRLQYDEWQNQQGEKRSRIRVRADRVQFLGTSQRSEYQDGPAPSGAAPAAAAYAPPAAPVAPAAPAPAAAPPAPPSAGGHEFPDDEENLPF